MNSDFENQLQRQEMRQVPGGWKANILQKVKEESQNVARPHPGPLLQGEGELYPAGLGKLRVWLDRLLWPCPQAWGAVAAVWVVIFCLDFSSSSSSAGMVATVSPPAPEVMAALQQQRLFKAELIGLAEPMEEPKRFISQPRSELALKTVAV